MYYMPICKFRIFCLVVGLVLLGEGVFDNYCDGAIFRLRELWRPETLSDYLLALELLYIISAKFFAPLLLIIAVWRKSPEFAFASFAFLIVDLSFLRGIKIQRLNFLIPIWQDLDRWEVSVCLFHKHCPNIQ